MAQKNKICLGCTRRFEGRRDAKTCSARCRKRVQRARSAYSLSDDWFSRAPAAVDRATVAHYKNGGGHARPQ